ncbi:hypothetical protein BH11BAC3_BH11BAC3_06890 [soil metagenome]
MKTSLMRFSTFMLLCLFFTTAKLLAQQMPVTSTGIEVNRQITSTPRAGTYTYQVYTGPGQAYGYDIFRDGKIIYHQPEMAAVAGKQQPIFTEKMQADKAAMLAIEKIKAGRPADLTMQELKLVTALRGKN